MKKHLLLIGIFILESVLFVNAQLTTASNEYQANNDNDTLMEYATVGSVMPYKVSPFGSGALKEIFAPSMFKWWLNGNATGYELLKIDGKVPLQLLPPPNHVYYPDSAIAIRWIKPGRYNIRVSEKVLPKNGFNVCDHTESVRTLDVQVFNKPSVAWKDTSSVIICNSDGTQQQIPLSLIGAQQIALNYKVEFTAVDGTSESFEKSRIFNAGKSDQMFRDSMGLVIPKGKYGIYKVFITDIEDKVSKKSGVKSGQNDIPSRPFTVKVYPLSNKPLFESRNISVCDGNTYMLRPAIPVQSITWETGNCDSSLLLSKTGYYGAEAMLPSGCVLRDSVYFETIPNPYFSLGRDTSLCEEETLLLNPDIQVTSYLWSTGDNTSSVAVNAGAGIVWVKLTNEYGCTSADTILISSCKPQSLISKIPNAFTPNNDSDNDTWTIALLDKYPDASVSIYNRWGQIVFKCPKDYNATAWDGTYNGKELPMSTYFYVIDLKDGKAPIVGSVNLIR
jgi:gliding motility-associated-like protein